MPNLMRYHQSITAELDAVKSRVRDLVTHWPTDGEWKEAALRTVLRRYLPSGNVVGRGFIAVREESSTQIDVLVLKERRPTLFRDGDLTVVTPDVPAAIVEVKTGVVGAENWDTVVRKLVAHGALCQRVANNTPWLGVFAYEGTVAQAGNILNAVARVHAETGIAVDCISCGYDLFVRYWPEGECEPGDDEVVDAEHTFWRAYRLNRFSPSYFISNLVDSICGLDRAETDYAWFPYREGKRSFRIAERATQQG